MWTSRAFPGMPLPTRFAPDSPMKPAPFTGFMCFSKEKASPRSAARPSTTPSTAVPSSPSSPTTTPSNSIRATSTTRGWRTPMFAWAVSGSSWTMTASSVTPGSARTSRPLMRPCFPTLPYRAWILLTPMSATSIGCSATTPGWATSIPTLISSTPPIRGSAGAGSPSMTT